VYTQTSLPSESAKIQNARAWSSLTSRPAGREGGFDSGNGIVVRNSQIKMNSVALRARFVHLLEPERRTASGRVH
jgi:hypothetical protein